MQSPYMPHLLIHEFQQPPHTSPCLYPHTPKPLSVWLLDRNAKQGNQPIYCLASQLKSNAAKPCRYWHKARFGTFCTLNQPRIQSTNCLFFLTQNANDRLASRFFCTWRTQPNSAVLDYVYQTVSRAQVIIKSRFDWLV